jgi:hypothetical protein
MKGWLLPAVALLGLAAVAVILRQHVGMTSSLGSQSATISPVEGGDNCAVAVRSSGTRAVMPCEAVARYLQEDSKLRRSSTVELVQINAAGWQQSGLISRQLLLAGFQVGVVSIQRGGIVRVGIVTEPDRTSMSGGNSER